MGLAACRLAGARALVIGFMAVGGRRAQVTRGAVGWVAVRKVEVATPDMMLTMIAPARTTRCRVPAALSLVSLENISISQVSLHKKHFKVEMVRSVKWRG